MKCSIVYNATISQDFNRHSLAGCELRTYHVPVLFEETNVLMSTLQWE